MYDLPKLHAFALHIAPFHDLKSVFTIEVQDASLPLTPCFPSCVFVCTTSSKRVLFDGVTGIQITTRFIWPLSKIRAGVYIHPP